jgi:hypothetical protein
MGGGCNNKMFYSPSGGGFAATIVGGIANEICNTSSGSFIGGGQGNIINQSGNATILGGAANKVISTSFSSNIVGGECNEINCAFQSSILGGCCNTISKNLSVIVGGCKNTTTQCLSFIGSGCLNTLQGNFNSASSIVGGICNNVGSVASSILGGTCNTIVPGANKSFIVGSDITATRACTTFVNNLSIMNIPTSGTGLPSGSIYRETATNYLKIVP